MHHTNSPEQSHPRRKQRWSSFGQGLVEYALVMVFTGLGLVIVTSSVFVALDGRVGTVLCNVGNEGREPLTEAECVAFNSNPDVPIAPPDDPANEPDDPDDFPQAPVAETNPPIANFTCTCLGYDCILDASASFDQDEDRRYIRSYTWDFGTGTGFETPIADPVAEKTYAVEQVYNVTLRVEDDEGDIDTLTDTCRVDVDADMPQAAFTYDNPTGRTIAFDASISRDGDDNGQAIVRYQWDIDGDNVYDYDIMQNPMLSHTYNDIGVQVVSLRVTDDEGDIAEITNNNVKVGAGPVAVASGFCDGLVANFVGSDSFDRDNPNANNRGIDNWTWNFGEGMLDGQSLISGDDPSIQDPQNVRFPTTDAYTVRLTVIDEDDQELDSVQITVQCGNQPPELAPQTDLGAIAGGPIVTNTSTTVRDDENERIDISLQNLPDWVTVAASDRGGVITYTIEAPLGSEAASPYRGEICARDETNPIICAPVNVQVTANNEAQITDKPFTIGEEDRIQGYRLMEGTVFRSSDVYLGDQYAWDFDVDAQLTIEHFLVVGDERLPAPGFMQVDSTDAGVVTDQLGTYRRYNIEYTFTPQFGDGGTYTIESCVTDGIMAAPNCDQFTVDVTVPEDGEGPTCPTNPNIDGLVPGAFDQDRFDGMTVYSLPRNANNLGQTQIEQWQSDHPLMAYDTARGQDTSLNTPNENFGGQGVGSGGESGQYKNNTALSNALVIGATRGTPDDYEFGGQMVFDFAYPAVVGTLTFIDVTVGESPTVNLYDFDGNLLFSQRPAVGGPNSIVSMNIDQNRVDRMEISFPSGGALDQVTFCDELDEGDDDDDADDDDAELRIVAGGIQDAPQEIIITDAELRNTTDDVVEDVSLRMYFSPFPGADITSYSATFTDSVEQTNPNEAIGTTSVTGPVLLSDNIYYFDFTILDELPSGASYIMSMTVTGAENILICNRCSDDLDNVGIVVDGAVVGGDTPETDDDDS